MNKDEIEHIVATKYSIGPLKEAPVEIRGDVDLNYKLTTNTGTYLLKKIINTANLMQFEMLGSLHEYLIKNSIPVPIVHKSIKGAYVEDSCILYSYIEGEVKTDWTDKEILSVTNTVAHMLIALEKYPVPDFVKNKNDKYTQGYNIRYCHDTLLPAILELNCPQAIKNIIIETITTLYAILPDFEKLPKFLVHGDLNEKNILFQNERVSGIIDFGISYDPIVYDLGEFCYWFTMPAWSETFNNEQYKIIIDTFKKIKPISKEEERLVPYMILRRGMMDIILTLQYFWDNKSNVALPVNRLRTLTRRNANILHFIQNRK